MMQVEGQFKRSIAYKVFLSDIAQLPFVKGDGTSTSNYLEHGSIQINRVNVVGTIIQKQGSTSLVMEDSTSQMQLRVFEDIGLLQNIEIGDAVLVIGRPREYGSERYILPEIVKKIDPAWLKVRNKEISLLSDSENINSNNSKSLIDQVPHTSKKNEIAENDAEEIRENPSEIIIDYIKNKDRGDGVDIEDIVEARAVDNVEKHITMLLKNGDVFEIRPGRIKVLE